MSFCELLKAASFALIMIFFSSCNKGLSLKIQDQDVFAFGAQESCNFVTTPVLANTLRVSWKSSTPVLVLITRRVPKEYDSEIISAAEKWNTVLGQKILTIQRDDSFNNPSGSDRVNAVYWSTEWDEDQKAQQARTAIRWDLSKLTDADVKINAKHFYFYKTSDSNSKGRVHLESLMVHEFGHALGLTHIIDPTSVMLTHLKPESTRNQPGDVDLRSLKCEY